MHLKHTQITYLKQASGIFSLVGTFDCILPAEVGPVPWCSELGVIEFRPICLAINLTMGCQEYLAMHYLPKRCTQRLLGKGGTYIH